MALPKIIDPTFEFTIPSNNKKVKLRPMKVREEKILLIAKQSGERSDIMNAVKQIVNNCIVTENTTVDKLAIFDLEYIFIKLRAISISNKTNVSYRDNEDDKVYDFTIDLDKLEIDITKAPSNKINLTNEVILELNWPTADLYTTAEIYNTEEADIFTFMLSACMSKIYEGDKVYDPTTATKEERTEFIDNITAKSAEQIRAFFAGIPTLHHELKYTNSKGTERVIELNSLDDFFTP